MKKPIVIVVALLAVAFVVRAGASLSATIPIHFLTKQSPITDHVRGNRNTPLTAYIYTDFECPYSKAHQTTISQLLAAHGNEINVIYRPFPFVFHRNAEKEAEAAECVAEQGGNTAFWKFHDHVFAVTNSNGTGFPLTQLAKAAADAGVDSAKFQTCLDSGKFAAAIAKVMKEGFTAGIAATPGNMIQNNATHKTMILKGAVPLSDLEAAILKVQ